MAPSELSVATAWPLPFALTAKIPGAAGTICTLSAAEAPTVVVTTTSTGPRPRFQGTWALICPAETKYSGAGTPPKVTDSTFPSAVASGMAAAVTVWDARLTPNTDAMEPGATPSPV